MQKNLFSIKSVLSVAILFLAFSFNANAQALNAETTSNSNAFNPPSAIDYNLFPVELNSNYVPDETQSLLFDNGSVRSEERRVGKERRCRSSAIQVKKKE